MAKCQPLYHSGTSFNLAQARELQYGFKEGIDAKARKLQLWTLHPVTNLECYLEFKWSYGSIAHFSKLMDISMFTLLTMTDFQIKPL